MTTTYADICNKARALNFGLSFYLDPYFLYVSSDGSGEPVHLRRLTCAFVAQKYKYKKILYIGSYSQSAYQIVWFETLYPIQQFSVILGWFEPVLSKGSVSCSRTQKRIAFREVRTHNPSISSQALYHWATTLLMSLVDHFCVLWFSGFCVCSSLPFGHLLGKGWPLISCWWCLLYFCHFPMWYPGAGVVLDCILSWSLPPFFYFVQIISMIWWCERFYFA